MADHFDKSLHTDNSAGVRCVYCGCSFGKNTTNKVIRNHIITTHRQAYYNRELAAAEAKLAAAQEFHEKEDLAAAAAAAALAAANDKVAAVKQRALLDGIQLTGQQADQLRAPPAVFPLPQAQGALSSALRGEASSAPDNVRLLSMGTACCTSSGTNPSTFDQQQRSPSKYALISTSKDRPLCVTPDPDHLVCDQNEAPPNVDEQFWTCECETDYVHSTVDLVCANCGKFQKDEWN